jgi:hypothetical protein
VQRSNARHYKSLTITQVEEFPGRAHLMLAQAGWEEIADHALAWAARHAVPDARRARPTPHPESDGPLGERRPDDPQMA